MAFGGTKRSSGCNSMINREAGVFQTSYRSDMALYTLPLAKITVWVTLGLLLILPLPLVLGNNEHAMSIVNTIRSLPLVRLDSIFSMATRVRSLLDRGPSWRWGDTRRPFYRAATVCRSGSGSWPVAAWPPWSAPYLASRR